MTAIATAAPSIEGLEDVLLSGDLGSLNPYQRVAYYQRVCESVGLNPLTQPFEYLRLNGRTILYARRAATEQLRRIHRVSIAIASRDVVEGCYVVTARATTPDGRTDESIGAVPIEGLKGENLANAVMKAETKAKRRVTLAICGLSFLDESELEGVRGAERVPMPAQPVPQLAAATEPEVTQPERQTIQQLFTARLHQQKTAAALVAWMREVIAHNFEETVKRELWRMFAQHARRFRLDPVELANLAQTANSEEQDHG